MSLRLPPVPPEISDLEPYKPGKPIEELERELGIKGAIKLASNENPLGPSPKAQAAIARAVAGLHRYPDGAGFELRSALARRFKVGLESVCLGNGSDELIEFVCRGFIRPGDKALAAAPSFLMYAKLVQVAGGRLTEVPLKDFRIDLKAMLAAIDERTRVIFINNPDNPAGTALYGDELGDFLAQVPEGVLVVLDEAYIEFARDPRVAQGPDFLTLDRPLLVMRTFSKSYGLAGLRIGFGLADPQIVAVCDRVRQPFNTSILAQVGALAALEDQGFLARSRELVAEGLAQFYACFDELGLFYPPSQANFVLVRVGSRASEVADQLLRRGVIVRKMDSYRLPSFLRVSVGLPQENQRFVTEFSDIISGGRP